MLDALWAEVVGQPRLVEDLRAAAADPVQAYLLVGPEGSGKRAAATAFAAAITARGLDPEAARRTVRLAGAMAHPSIHVVERVGANITVEDAREVVRMASRAPAEGGTQVFILDEFHLVREAAPTLLKAIEEPEQGTIFVVLAEEVTEGLVTIASRCAQHTLSPVPLDAVVDHLISAGVDPGVASEAARGAEGSLRRAHLLADDPNLVSRRAVWRDASGALDGTGATLVDVADELLGLIDGVLEPLEVRQQAEVSAFEEMVEVTGDKSRGRRDAMEKRHKREARRLRTAELVSGSSALLDGYRRSASQGSPGATDAFVAASVAVQHFNDAIRSNGNERLALLDLLLALDVAR